MPDILASVEFGEDNGIKCDCGAATFLVDDQGSGLKAYECEKGCGTFQVQFDSPIDEDDPEDFDGIDYLP